MQCYPKRITRIPSVLRRLRRGAKGCDLGRFQSSSLFPERGRVRNPGGFLKRKNERGSDLSRTKTNLLILTSSGERKRREKPQKGKRSPRKELKILDFVWDWEFRGTGLKRGEETLERGSKAGTYRINTGKGSCANIQSSNGPDRGTPEKNYLLDESYMKGKMGGDKSRGR